MLIFIPVKPSILILLLFQGLAKSNRTYLVKLIATCTVTRRLYSLHVTGLMHSGWIVLNPPSWHLGVCLAQATLSQKVQSSGFGLLIPKLLAQCCSQHWTHRRIGGLGRNRRAVLEILDQLGWALGLSDSNVELGLKTLPVSCCWIIQLQKYDHVLQPHPGVADCCTLPSRRLDLRGSASHRPL